MTDPREVAISHHAEGDADIISVAGDLDVYGYAALREAARDPAIVARGRLVIDLTGTTFLDSYGLGAIIGTLRRIRAADGSLAVVCAHELILKSFRITATNKVLTICDTVAEALAEVRKDSDG
jgi:anti-sigma B factor antagonist